MFFNLFCFSYFYRGRRFFLKPYVVHRGSCFLGSLFSLILLLYKFTVYLLIGFSLSICDKKGKKQRKFSLFIQGEMKLFLKGGEKKNIYIYIYILMYLTQGESQFVCLLFAYGFIFVVIYCFSVFISTHVVMCSFECFRKDRYILIKIFCLFLQLLGQESQIGICDVFGHFIVYGHSVVSMFCHGLPKGEIVRF